MKTKTNSKPKPKAAKAMPNARDLSGPTRTNHTISDGRIVSVLNVPRAKDMVRAQRVVPASDKGESYAQGLAMVAALCLIDGQPKTYEDLEEEPIWIANELIQLLPLTAKKESSAKST